MRATMAHPALTIPMIFRHGARIHSTSVIRHFEGASVGTASFADVAASAARLAAALQGLGLRTGDCVGTLCWNHLPHMTTYLAVPSMGAVLHTLNCRLSAEQLAFVIEDAEDRTVIADAALAPLLAEALRRTRAVETVIFVGRPQHPFTVRPSFDYDALLSHAPAEFDWPEPDEAAPAVACYTSGTTGNPKGVVYSHRSIFLHSLGSLGVDTFGVRQTDRVLLLPPMFHANAWGLPYSAWFGGADLILPGPDLGSPALRRIIDQERPTFSAMVPTLLNDLLVEHRKRPLDMSSFRMLVSGGSAVPVKLVREAREAWGLSVIQGWGMTETGPVCALTIPPRGMTDPAELDQISAKGGRPAPGTELRVVGPDGALLPQDGVAVGELQIRGIWTTGRYHNDQSPESFTPDGWIRTGDVGTIDPAGYAQLTDRAKDVIKSGGEWISSAELESLLLEMPGVAEVAVVAIPDERWGERPLAVIVAEGEAPRPAAMRAHLRPLVARFWVPEYWAIVPSLPRTSVGKIDKKLIRANVMARQFEFARVESQDIVGSCADDGSEG